MLPLWTQRRHSSFAAFILLFGLAVWAPSEAALTKPDVEIDPVLPSIPLPVEIPSLSGSRFSSRVELRWSIDCSVTAVNIQESINNQSWASIYTGLGQADNTAAYATFAVGGMFAVVIGQADDYCNSLIRPSLVITIASMLAKVHCVALIVLLFLLALLLHLLPPRLQPLSRLLQPIQQGRLAFLGLASVALRVMSYSNALMVAHGLRNILERPPVMLCRDSLRAPINIKCGLAQRRAVPGSYQVILRSVCPCLAVIGKIYRG